MATIYYKQNRAWKKIQGLGANFTSFTIGTSHKDGRRVMRTYNVADFLLVGFVKLFGGDVFDCGNAAFGAP